MKGKRIFLNVYFDGRLKSRNQFDLEQVSIGSNADGPNLSLKHPSVCFWHALIEKREDKYFISDLGTPTGTFVNEQPVLESEIEHGDRIQVGDYVLQFCIGVPFVQGQTQTSFAASPQTSQAAPAETGVAPAEAGATQTEASAPPAPPSAAEDIGAALQKEEVPGGPDLSQNISSPAGIDAAQADTDGAKADQFTYKKGYSYDPVASSSGGAARNIAPETQEEVPKAPVKESQSDPLKDPLVNIAPARESEKINENVPAEELPSLEKTVPVKEPPPLEKTVPLPDVSPSLDSPQADQNQVPHFSKETLPAHEAPPPHHLAGKAPPSPGHPPVYPQPAQGSSRIPPAQEKSVMSPPPAYHPQAQQSHSASSPPAEEEFAPPGGGRQQPHHPQAPAVPSSQAPVRPPQNIVQKPPPVSQQQLYHSPQAPPQAGPGEDTLVDIFGGGDGEKESLSRPAVQSQAAPKRKSLFDVAKTMPSAHTHGVAQHAMPAKQSQRTQPDFVGKKTYAPESEVKDLEKTIPLGSGGVVEVLVAWKERILSCHHFSSRGKTVVFGSSDKADIMVPNMLGTLSYPLLDLKKTPYVNVSGGVKASLIDENGKHSFTDLQGRGMVKSHASKQSIALGQGQVIRLNFRTFVDVYVRLCGNVQKATSVSLFGFNFSEMVGIMMSFFFMSMLVFYMAMYSPHFLELAEDLESEKVKKATIVFKKKPPPRRVKIDMAKQSKTAAKKKVSMAVPNAPKKKSPGIKKPGKEGKMAQVAAKPKTKSKKKTVTSAKPGGSVKTGKAGGGAKSPRPDPTKVGLLAVFGQKGTQQVLDQAYTGVGELAGLAEQATGHAGQKDSHGGEGIGTKFKNEGAGGKGTALIGVSGGIKTKGRGGGVQGYGRGGSLGTRGSAVLELGTDDWSVEGGIDKGAIRRVIRRNAYQLEQCYESIMARNPELGGKIVMKWEILNERVKKVKAMSNTTGSVAMAKCIGNRIRNFRFTGTGLKPNQIGEVRIPFAFSKK